VRAVQVILPYHLRNLAGVGAEVRWRLTRRSLCAVCSTLSKRAIRCCGGRFREYGTGQRRAFLRFFACEQDLSHLSPDLPLPDAVAAGREAAADYRGHRRG